MLAVPCVFACFSSKMFVGKMDYVRCQLAFNKHHPCIKCTHLYCKKVLWKAQLLLSMLISVLNGKNCHLKNYVRLVKIIMYRVVTNVMVSPFCCYVVNAGVPCMSYIFLFVLLEWQEGEQVSKYAWFEKAGIENTKKEQKENDCSAGTWGRIIRNNIILPRVTALQSCI